MWMHDCFLFLHALVKRYVALTRLFFTFLEKLKTCKFQSISVDEEYRKEENLCIKTRLGKLGKCLIEDFK